MRVEAGGDVLEVRHACSALYQIFREKVARGRDRLEAER
jgi:hypothetical protein